MIFNFNIVDYCVSIRHKKNTKLDAIGLMFDWKPAAKRLEKASKGEKWARGRHPGV